MMRLIFLPKASSRGILEKKSNQFDIGKQHGHGQIKRATSCEMALSKRLVELGDVELSGYFIDLKVKSPIQKI
ncbi:hypothetical protein [Aeromonas veronii]|uniref:hypothetical protein n=1 Tax=Aeromonas veronii TaxID=654 RepID=UPI0011CC3C15|nr:hypothetical protein [Aeromonas veronii]